MHCDVICVNNFFFFCKQSLPTIILQRAAEEKTTKPSKSRGEVKPNPVNRFQEAPEQASKHHTFIQNARRLLVLSYPSPTTVLDSIERERERETDKKHEIPKKDAHINEWTDNGAIKTNCFLFADGWLGDGKNRLRSVLPGVMKWHCQAEDRRTARSVEKTRF